MESKALALGKQVKMESKALALGKEVKMESKALALGKQVKAEALNSNVLKSGGIMKHPFRFDLTKAIETILYLVEKLPIADFPHIFKTIYFADETHLVQWGCFICGDSYIAMKYGPVPNNIFNLLKAAKGDNVVLAILDKGIVAQVMSAFTVQDDYVVKALRKVDLGWLSESEVKCLDSAINQYGTLSVDELSRLSHEAPWENAGGDDCIDVADIIATLPNADILLEHVKNPHP
jgi:uncharacterized phage-associated protein